jgi:outer membrane usher protein FimD/PapC
MRRKAGPFVAFDDTARSVRVYPGTVRTLTWETAPIVAVFAQAVRPDGSPVANALLVESEARIRTDAQGYFQAEVGTQDGLILRPAEGPTCRIDLPDFAPDTEFRDLGQLTCKETDR